MYLEGVKDGRRRLTWLTRINRRKPVIIYKGGLTEAGARAVSSIRVPGRRAENVAGLFPAKRAVPVIHWRKWRT